MKKSDLWRHYRSAAGDIGGLVFLTLFFVVAGTFFGSVLTPLLIGQLFDSLKLSQGDFTEVWNNTYLYVIAGFASLVFWRLTDYFLVKNETMLMRNFLVYAFNKFQAHSPQFHADNPAPELEAKAARFARSAETIYDNIVFNLVPFMVEVIGISYILLQSGVLFAVLAWVWVILFVSLAFFLSKRRMRFDEKAEEEHTKMVSLFNDILSNISLVIAYGKRNREYATFEDQADTLRIKRRKAWHQGTLNNTVYNLLTYLLDAIVLISLVVLLVQSSITPGFAIMAILYVSRISGTIWRVAHAMTRMGPAVASAKEAIVLFEEEVTVADPLEPESLIINEGEICFENVSFTYRGDSEPVIKNFSLCIPKGKKVGIIGESGSCKSTLVKLLQRKEDVSSGVITIDGQRIDNISLKDLSTIFAVVDQENGMFCRTLAENLKYGNDDMTDQQMIAIAKKAGVHEFAVNLPDGYDTVIGSRGMKLSGGQRQRVGLARAFGKQALVTILDEATNALDAQNTVDIRDALNTLYAGSTILVIAHHLEMVKDLDVIYVMSKGKIVEQGTHEELLDIDGSYRKYWDMQHAEAVV